MNGRGQKAALYAAIGVAVGSVLGAAFVSSVGIFAIAILGVLGAVIGMFVGFAVERKGR